MPSRLQAGRIDTGDVRKKIGQVFEVSFIIETLQSFV
jgi:hypothetical protein